VAKYTLIIENSNGDRGEAIVDGYSARPGLVSWVIFPRKGPPIRGVPLPASLNGALKSFKQRCGTPEAPPGSGTDNTFAVFRCSGCLTPRQDRRLRLRARCCPNDKPSGPSVKKIIAALYQPYRVAASDYISNNKCW